MRSNSILRLMAVLMALTLAASACGGSGGDDLSDLAADAGDDGDDSGDDGGDSDAGDSGDAGDEGSDSMDDGDDDGDDQSTTDEGDDEGDDGGGFGDGDFCDLVVEQDRLSDAFSPLSGPDAVREYYSALPDLIDQALVIGPDELRADFEIMREAMAEAVTILEANEWDFLEAAEDLETVFTPEVDAAGERIDAWGVEFCGIEAEVDFDDDGGTAGGEGDLENPFDDLGMTAEVLEQMLSTEFGRQAFAQGFAESGDVTVEEALCLLDNMEVSALLGMAEGGTPDADAMVALFEAFDTCGVDAAAIIG